MDAGKFKAEVMQDAKIIEGKTDAVVVSFALRSGPDNGETIDAWLYLSEKALPYTIKKLQACGWKGSLLDFSGMAGTPVMVTIQHEEFNGEQRAKVGFIDAYREGAENETGASAAAVAAKWQAKIDALTGKNQVNFPD